MDKIVWTQTLQLDDSVNVYFIQKTILTNSSIKQQKRKYNTKMVLWTRKLNEIVDGNFVEKSIILVHI